MHEASGLCLSAEAGDVSVLASHTNRAGDEIVYTETQRPRLRLEKPTADAGAGFQMWYFDTSKDSWGKPVNVLTHRVKFDPYGRFALRIGVGGRDRDERDAALLTSTDKFADAGQKKPSG
ncbi:hypothetical protein ACFQL8_37405 [Streptomyces goshikiensis]|uniref:hypothetical protein n=1 Tax=Streptomyces goshikiensis TaxID=1942 RepID=UPI001677BF7E|nr:hypothetical protein [Streptomyces goshikiensis]GHD80145.1 hypothetical protein GCM10010336_63390 [Streptomyces goshikiensis]